MCDNCKCNNTSGLNKMVVGKIEFSPPKPQSEVFEGVEKAVTDMVNHPPHYNNRRMEAIDIIEMIIEIEENSKVAYNMSNVLKYILRFRDKGTEIKDLEKSMWYLNRMIEKVKEEKSD